MNPLWTYFWPLLVSGLILGGIAASIGFRRGSVAKSLSAGVVLAVGAVLLWHGPLGAADRFSGEVERLARGGLDSWEMTEVKAHLHRGPLTRTLVLSGPADDFQTSELVKIMNTVPGVSGSRWTDTAGGPPLIAEGIAVAILGFLFGLLLAYLVELRRRYNAQWSW